jgi:hypothetical protein
MELTLLCMSVKPLDSFPAFYGTYNFISSFMRALDLSHTLSHTILVHTTPSNQFKVRLSAIHPLTAWVSSLAFPKMTYIRSLVRHSCYMPRLSHPLHSGWTSQIQPPFGPNRCTTRDISLPPRGVKHIIKASWRNSLVLLHFWHLLLQGTRFSVCARRNCQANHRSHVAAIWSIELGPEHVQCWNTLVPKHRCCSPWVVP